MLLDGEEYVATIDYERRPSDDHWVASRIVELDEEGEQSFARGATPAVDVAAEPVTAADVVAAEEAASGGE